jgi:hypothetical protein
VTRRAVLTAQEASDVPAHAPGGTSVAELTREIDELETLPRFDRDGAGERALRALAVAGS